MHQILFLNRLLDGFGKFGKTKSINYESDWSFGQPNNVENDQFYGSFIAEIGDFGSGYYLNDFKCCGAAKFRFSLLPCQTVKGKKRVYRRYKPQNIGKNIRYM